MEKSNEINIVFFSRGSLPKIGYKMLCNLLVKEADEIIIDLTKDYFQLDKYLSDDRMKTNFAWVEILTTLFERILGCLGQEKRIAEILVRKFLCLVFF